jgi:hypothetical protein
MKSITKLCLLLSLGILIVACNNKSKSSDTINIERPDMALTYYEIINMLKHYDKTRKMPLERAHGGTEDTRINFIKLEELKKYIAYIEQESNKKDIPLAGINFISAAYPDDWTVKRKQNYQTIILMPATTIGDEEGVSFDPLQSNKGEPMSLKEILFKDFNYDWYYDKVKINTSIEKSKKARSANGVSDDLSSGGNRAGISPPM